MELEEIRQLLELLKDTDISEIQIERDGSRLKIKRERFVSSYDIVPPPTSQQHPQQQPAAAETAPETTVQNTISSPIVGIFHRSPAPEAPPFVDVGTTVHKGQVLCIIEAMKLMNEIESDVDGVVKKIFVENGQPVEYGEPLFIIDPLS